MDQSIVTATPLIDVHSVSYTYPLSSEKPSASVLPAVLSDVSFSVYPGEYVSLVGHNGSGKSTLARHCNALLIPDQGNVIVGGMDTRELHLHRAIRDRVGMIFQNPDNQLIATVVDDDVAWGLAVRGIPREIIRERVEMALDIVGVSSLRQLSPGQLSGGQRQRVAIAGILALRPDCIIADEATSMLDPFSRHELVKLLHQINKKYGITILHVTHLLEETFSADRILVIDKGRIVLDCQPVTLFADLARLREFKLIIPDPILLVNRLRQVGFPISTQAMTLEEIAREIVP